MNELSNTNDESVYRRIIQKANDIGISNQELKHLYPCDYLNTNGKVKPRLYDLRRIAFFLNTSCLWIQKGEEDPKEVLLG